MKTLTIAARFCGPASSSNGGYFAGLVATLASRTLAVRLLKPPPLDTELAVRELADGALQVVQGEEPIGEAHPALLELDVPPAPRSSTARASCAARRARCGSSRALPPRAPEGRGARRTRGARRARDSAAAQAHHRLGVALTGGGAGRKHRLDGGEILGVELHL